MRRLSVFVCAFAPLAAPAAAPDALDGFAITYDENRHKVIEIVSPVRETPGTPAELTARAQACIGRTFSTSSAALGSILEALGGNFARNKDVGAPVIELADKDAGQIIANSVVAYTSALLTYQIKARVTFQAKDGRFRFVHTDMATARSDGRSDFTPLVAAWGTGWEPATRALIAKTGAVADCITQPVTDSNW